MTNNTANTTPKHPDTPAIDGVYAVTFNGKPAQALVMDGDTYLFATPSVAVIDHQDFAMADAGIYCSILEHEIPRTVFGELLVSYDSLLEGGSHD